MDQGYPISFQEFTEIAGTKCESAFNLIRLGLISYVANFKTKIVCLYLAGYDTPTDLTNLDI